MDLPKGATSPSRALRLGRSWSTIAIWAMEMAPHPPLCEEMPSSSCGNSLDGNYVNYMFKLGAIYVNHV